MEEQLIEKLNKYLQSLTVAQQNAHILHWNVVGEGFRSAHLQFKDVYEDFFNKTDEVAELIRIHDGIPTASLTDCIQGSQIEEISSKRNFKVLNALKMCLEDVKDIIDICNDVVIFANENNFIDVSDTLGSHSSDIGKLKYFLDSMSSEESDLSTSEIKKERTDFKNLDVDRSESDYIKNPGADYERPDAPGKPKTSTEQNIKDFRN